MIKSSNNTLFFWLFNSSNVQQDNCQLSRWRWIITCPYFSSETKTAHYCVIPCSWQPRLSEDRNNYVQPKTFSRRRHKGQAVDLRIPWRLTQAQLERSTLWQPIGWEIKTWMWTCAGAIGFLKLVVIFVRLAEILLNRLLNCSLKIWNRLGSNRHETVAPGRDETLPTPVLPWQFCEPTSSSSSLCLLLPCFFILTKAFSSVYLSDTWCIVIHYGAATWI